MRLPRKYAITDSRRYGNNIISLVEDLLKKTDVRMIQLREKGKRGRELYKMGLELREVTSRYSALLIINERFDIALAVSADGVHLPERSFPPSVVKRIAPNLMVGFSAHSLESALYAEREGADFITLSPIFPTPSHPEAKPLGIEELEKVTKSVNIPVYALGGIKEENAEECLRRGAYGIAGISIFFDKVALK